MSLSVLAPLRTNLVEKVCITCEESWPNDEEFYWHYEKLDGSKHLRNVCKACTVEKLSKRIEMGWTKKNVQLAIARR